MKKRYYYSGPVIEFDRLVSERWSSSTIAETDAKAISNLAYQFKKNNNRTRSAKISLPGKLIMEEIIDG